MHTTTLDIFDKDGDFEIAIQNYYKAANLLKNSILKRTGKYL